MSQGKRDFLDKYGPWAVVTGASDGIGAAFALELAARGMNLVLVARRRDRLERMAGELTAKFGIAVRIQPTDLADRASAQRLLNDTQDLPVGLLVASAGFGSSGPLVSSDARVETELVEVNCAAVLQQCLHFGRRMAAQKRGGLVLLSSVLAFQGAPLCANYAASKAYIQTLAEGLGGELAGDGVDVLSVAPGPIASGFAAHANLQLGQTMSPEVVARISLAALGKQTTVRPGWLSKLLGWGLATAPRFLRVRIIGKIMGTMTRHQRPAKPLSGPADTR